MIEIEKSMVLLDVLENPYNHFTESIIRAEDFHTNPL